MLRQVLNLAFSFGNRGLGLFIKFLDVLFSLGVFCLRWGSGLVFFENFPDGFEEISFFSMLNLQAGTFDLFFFSFAGFLVIPLAYPSFFPNFMIFCDSSSLLLRLFSKFNSLLSSNLKFELLISVLPELNLYKYCFFKTLWLLGLATFFKLTEDCLRLTCFFD